MAGYFDTHNKEVVLFDYSYFNKDMVFVNENHSLSLYEADVDVKSFVDISLLQGEEKVGDIVSVSYTHLDVYKRQVHTNAQQQIMIMKNYWKRMGRA